MDYNACTLTNGLRIIHLPSQSQVMYCGYAIKAGTRDELPGEEGLAHFCEHTTFKGTQRRRAWHVLNCLDSVGGELNAFTTKMETVYHAALPCAHTVKAVDLLTDIVFHSTYPQNEIDKEVEVICDEIEMYNDTPSDLVFDEFENLIFSHHPLGHSILGEAAHLRQYTTADALRFTSRLYIPANAVFFAYGDIDFRRVVRMLCRAHGASVAANQDVIQSAPNGVKLNATDLPEYSPVNRVKEMDTHLAHVMTGIRTSATTDNRRFALYLLNNILGGTGMNTRLNLSLRERHALVYTVESMTVNYIDTGLWGVYFGCDHKNIDRCMRLVSRELDRLASCPITDSQLRAAKKQAKGQITVAGDSHENFAIDFAKEYLHYGRMKDVAAVCRAVDAVTADEMQQVARELFAPDRLTTMIIK